MPSRGFAKINYDAERVSDLVIKVAHGDQAAFIQLYDATSSIVYGMALRLLRNHSIAEDITLEVYLQVWRCAGSYFADRGSVSSWLVMICRNRAIDWLRSTQGRQARSVELVDCSIPDPGQSPEESCLATQRTRAIKNCLAQLPTEQRQLIELAYFSALSQTQIAAQLGLPLGTVKSRIRMGMARLRDSLPLAGARGLL